MLLLGMYETESTQGDHKPTQIEKSKTAAGMVYECGGFPVLSHFLNKQTEGNFISMSIISCGKVKFVVV